MDNGLSKFQTSLIKNHLISSNYQDIVSGILSKPNRRESLFWMFLYVLINVRLIILLWLNPDTMIVKMLADETKTTGKIGNSFKLCQLSTYFYFIFSRFVLYSREGSNQLEILTDFRHYLNENINNAGLKILYLDKEHRRKFLAKAGLLHNYFFKIYQVSIWIVILLYTGLFSIFILQGEKYQWYQKLMAVFWNSFFIYVAACNAFNYLVIFPISYISVYYNKLCAEQFKQRLIDLAATNPSPRMMNLSMKQAMNDYRTIIKRVSQHDSTFRILVFVFEYFMAPLCTLLLHCSVEASYGIVRYTIGYFALQLFAISFGFMVSASSIYSVYQLIYKTLNVIYLRNIGLTGNSCKQRVCKLKDYN